MCKEIGKEMHQNANSLLYVNRDFVVFIILFLFSSFLRVYITLSEKSSLKYSKNKLYKNFQMFVYDMAGLLKARQYLQLFIYLVHYKKQMNILEKIHKSKCPLCTFHSPSISATWKLSEPSKFGIFTGASSHKHDPFLLHF